MYASDAISATSPPLPVRIMGATLLGTSPADKARHTAGPAANGMYAESCRAAEVPRIVSSSVVNATGMMRVKSKPLSSKV